MSQTEIAIIGAGMTGLLCAQRLQQAGHQVVVVEKSRGVGGRMATRRLPAGTIADHGTCYLSPKGETFRQFLQNFIAKGIVQEWTDSIYRMDGAGQLSPPEASDRKPRYATSVGMTAIAKSLAEGLEIRFNQRAIDLTLQPDQRWRIELEDCSASPAPLTLDAEAVIVTVPAPQAVSLLQPLVGQAFSAASFDLLKSVQFAPCLSVMAGYLPNREADWMSQYPEVKAIASAEHAEIAWIGVDSSKRQSSSHLVLVIQSTADFALKTLDITDLMPAGQVLLQQAAVLAPWIQEAEWVQVHRWRYAFAASTLGQPYWVAEASAPLICSGDWCSGMRVEDAYQSALKTADYLHSRLTTKLSRL